METYTFQSLGGGEYMIFVKVNGNIASFYTINESNDCTIDQVSDNLIIVNMKDKETGEVSAIPLMEEKPMEMNDSLISALENHIQDEQCY